MFSFHKPKIYRSINGCCICKAKSSSSRFTDSKKYESEFERCFRIREKRSGEICNACVLLVKRWKKLPPGTTRDWHHVVDARAGPGTKSIKGKTNNNDSSTTTSSNHNYHHHSHQTQLHTQKKKPKPKNHKNSANNSSLEDANVCDDSMMSECSELHNRIPSPTASDSSDDLDDEIEEDEEMDDDYEEEDDDDDDDAKRNNKSNNSLNKKSNFNSSSSSGADKRNNSNSTNTANKLSSFLDMTFWRKEKVCCGIIFRGPDNELLIYPKLFRPCCQRNNNNNNTKTNTNNTNGGSSDSGSIVSSMIEDDASSNASSTNISLT